MEELYESRWANYVEVSTRRIPQAGISLADLAILDKVLHKTGIAGPGNASIVHSVVGGSARHLSDGDLPDGSTIGHGNLAAAGSGGDSDSSNNGGSGEREAAAMLNSTAGPSSALCERQGGDVRCESDADVSTSDGGGGKGLPSSRRANGVEIHHDRRRDPANSPQHAASHFGRAGGSAKSCSSPEQTRTAAEASIDVSPDLRFGELSLFVGRPRGSSAESLLGGIGGPEPYEAWSPAGAVSDTTAAAAAMGVLPCVGEVPSASDDESTGLAGSEVDWTLGPFTLTHPLRLALDGGGSSPGSGVGSVAAPVPVVKQSLRRDGRGGQESSESGRGSGSDDRDGGDRGGGGGADKVTEEITRCKDSGVDLSVRGSCDAGCHGPRAAQPSPLPPSPPPLLFAPLDTGVENAFSRLDIGSPRRHVVLDTPLQRSVAYGGDGSWGAGSSGSMAYTLATSSRGIPEAEFSNRAARTVAGAGITGRKSVGGSQLTGTSSKPQRRRRLGSCLYDFSDDSSDDSDVKGGGGLTADASLSVIAGHSRRSGSVSAIKHDLPLPSWASASSVTPASPPPPPPPPRPPSKPGSSRMSA
ncbi:unnamed protein product, partial [Phaeothamnion confervicola]